MLHSYYHQLQEMDMGGFDDQGTGPIDNNAYAAPSYVAAEDLGLLDMLPIDNNAYAAPSYVAAEDLELLDMLSMDAVPLFGEVTLPSETSHNYFQPDPILLCEPLGQQQQSVFENFGFQPESSFECEPLGQQQQSGFESQQQSCFESQAVFENVKLKGGMSSSASITFEEHPAGLLSQVLGSGMSCNGNEALKAEQAVHPTIFSGYRMEDVIKKLGSNSALGLRNRGNYGSSSASKNGSNYESSSASKNDSNYKRQAQHQYPVKSYFANRGLSSNPECVAAPKRRKEFREKINCLEQIIPLRSKLETYEFLEVASKYVKFLQAQVRVLKHMPSSPSPLGSKDRLDLLHVLVTSPAVQRKLFREEKCVGTVQQYQMLAAATGSSK